MWRRYSRSILMRGFDVKTTRRFSDKISLNIHQSIAGRRRFYKEVDVDEIESTGTYKIKLDGRTLKTPGMNPLILPTEMLAIGIALEWDSQTNVKTGIVPASMPLMILASTAIDHVLADPSDAKKTCLSFLPTDTALFRTTSGDRILLAKQKEYHEPLVQWLYEAFKVQLETTDSMILRLKHPEESLRRIGNIVENMDHFTLTCLQSACMECKSLVVALALICRFIDFEQAKIASRLEEEFQIDIWGAVEGGHDMDRLNNTVACSSVDAFMHAYKSSYEIQNLIAN